MLPVATGTQGHEGTDADTDNGASGFHVVPFRIRGLDPAVLHGAREPNGIA
jgi:hypothetical protein